MKKINAFLFDLDGTLLDTAPDLALSINITRQSEGLPLLPHSIIRNVVSLGGTAMINAAFPDHSEAEKASLKSAFLKTYSSISPKHTSYFGGIELLLKHLTETDIPWGIMTNKPRWLTTPIISAFEFDQKTPAIVCGDDLENAKPHPQPLLHACELMNTKPSETLYIGDARRDIEAAVNAEMPSVAVLYGYIEQHDNPNDWGATGLVEHPSELIKWLT